MLLLLLLPAVALAASGDQHIVTGEDVDIANYPWQVSPSSSNKGFSVERCSIQFWGVRHLSVVTHHMWKLINFLMVLYAFTCAIFLGKTYMYLYQ